VFLVPFGLLAGFQVGCVSRSTTAAQEVPLRNIANPINATNLPRLKVGERLTRLPPIEHDTAVYHAPSENSKTKQHQRIEFLEPSEAAAEPAGEELPAPPAPIGPQAERVFVPLNSDNLPVDAQIQTNGELVTLSVREAPLHAVLTLLAQQQGLSLVASSNLKMPITVTLQPMPVEQALDAVLNVAGCMWSRRGNVIYVSVISKDTVSSPFIQGRVVKVFNLSYISATDAEKVITGLLSPVGRVFIRTVDVKDRRRTLEQMVVEDLPEYLNRIAQYVAEVDQPPRQVLIEARLLQVKLRNELLHGVNFQTLARLAGADIDFNVKGFANTAGPGLVFSVDGTDLNTLVNALEANTDAKTFANPKLLALNGQQSRIQIGKRLGYFVTTTTQTSTLQDVQFLEVGVVLDVTPTIANDGQILLKVKPEVSNGSINATTTLPEKETTEVETSVLLPDGHGIIIGGLIQETDIERQNKLPFLGDLWLIGRLFQRRSVERERSEVIVVLVPRIVPYDDCYNERERIEYERINAPLVTPELERAVRPWEPELHDSMRKPKKLW
jgi:type II secretory pathway component GspD/PulD (secretin)